MMSRADPNRHLNGSGRSNGCARVSSIVDPVELTAVEVV